jgi:hypothetical protein
MLIHNILSAKCQMIVRLVLLQLLIPEDGHFELELSLALDRVLIELEGA